MTSRFLRIIDKKTSNAQINNNAHVNVYVYGGICT